MPLNLDEIKTFLTEVQAEATEDPSLYAGAAIKHFKQLLTTSLQLTAAVEHQTRSIQKLLDEDLATVSGPPPAPPQQPYLVQVPYPSVPSQNPVYYPAQFSTPPNPGWNPNRPMTTGPSPQYIPFGPQAPASYPNPATQWPVPQPPQSYAVGQGGQMVLSQEPSFTEEGQLHQPQMGPYRNGQVIDPSMQQFMAGGNAGAAPPPGPSIWGGDKPNIRRDRV